MSKQNYVYSTLSNDNIYREWNAGGADLPNAGREVLIKGGANIADGRLNTPAGVANKVTEEELAFLMTEPTFKLHLANGFLSVSSSEVDPEVAAADMTQRDASAPMTPGDLEPAEPTEFEGDPKKARKA